MIDIKQQITVDIVPGLGSAPRVNVSQYDVGRVIIVSLVNAGVLMGKIADTTVTVEMTKPDHLGIVENAIYNADGTVQFVLTEQMAAVVGETYSKIRISDAAGNTVATAAFVLVVDRAGIDKDTKISASDIPAIVNAKGYADAAAASAKSAQSSADSISGKSKQIDENTSNISDEIIRAKEAEQGKVSESGGDTKDCVATYMSGDVEDGGATAWTSVPALKTGEKHRSLFEKISWMCKNVRYLFKTLGSTDISKIGDGSVTGAIASLNADLAKKAEASDLAKQSDSVKSNTSAISTLSSDLAKKMDSDGVVVSQDETNGWLIFTYKNGARHLVVRDTNITLADSSWNSIWQK